MRARCSSADDTSYKDYGGRGIRVLEPWESSFQAFYDDMIGTWGEGLTIDRKDVNGNYCKENCRWATDLEQANNKRNTAMLTLNGVSRSAADWARLPGFPSHGTIYNRHKRGWSDERALTEQVDDRGGRKTVRADIFEFD